MPAPKKPSAPDDKLESFHLWTDDRPRAPEGTPVVLVLASASVVAALALAWLAGWL